MQPNIKNTGKLKNGKEERYTFVIDSDRLNDMKNIAHWCRMKKYKTVFDTAITSFVDAWKADPANKAHVKGGKIAQRPEGE